MGYLNGDSKSKREPKQVKGKQGEKGAGFHLTADEHYHLKGKRLTNVSAPVNNHNAATKKFVTDLLKNKAGTVYVRNELAKKASQSKCEGLASDLNSVNTALAALNNKIKKLEATVDELQKAVKRRPRAEAKEEAKPPSQKPPRQQSV